MLIVRSGVIERPGLSGVLLLDKPSGPSSAEVLRQLGRLLRVDKLGHTGTLDPLASGMLVVCLGEATRFIRYLRDGDKRYQVTARLGVRTDTLDAAGEVIERHPLLFDQRSLLDALGQLRGALLQIPPMFSALKFRGRPLYRYARRGLVVERRPRSVVVRTLTLRSCWADRLSLEVECSGGTYVRSIVDDLGQLLGCGAYVSRLRRVGVEGYRPAGMVGLEVLRDAVGGIETRTAISEGLRGTVLPMSVLPGIADMPAVGLSATRVGMIRRGQSIHLRSGRPGGLVRLLDLDAGTFLGVGAVSSGQLAARRLVREGAIQSPSPPCSWVVEDEGVYTEGLPRCLHGSQRG